MEALHLHITSHSCTCGNKWTSSKSWLRTLDGAWGGTPSPLQLHKLQHISYHKSDEHHSGCFRCVPLQLSEGWTKPLVEAWSAPEPRPQGRTARAQQSITELEKDILG